MMMWSCTSTPSLSPAWMIFLVMSMSAMEGVGSPEGWLCTRMMAVEASSSARLHHFARIDRRVVDRALLLHLVGDQLVLLVEEEDAELFACFEGHGGAAIVDNRLP
jgi:hypothetical protein